LNFKNANFHIFIIDKSKMKMQENKQRSKLDLSLRSALVKG